MLVQTKRHAECQGDKVQKKTHTHNTFWMILGFIISFFGTQGITPASAKPKADFLKAEGAPVSVAKALEKGLRKAAQQRGNVQILPNPIAPAMAQLTLGCAFDSAACVKGLAKMRNAQIIFHLRVLPFGSKAKVIFRKLDGKTGKILKTVSYRFRRRKIKKALRILSNKMFGRNKTTKRPPVVARRHSPKKRPIERRPAPRKIATVVRHIPQKRVAVPTRRTQPRAIPNPIVKRTVPPTRRTLVVRRTPPIPRITSPVKKRPVVRKKLVKRIKKTEKSVPLASRPSFWGWICVGVAVAAAGGFLAFGLDSASKQNDVQTLINRSKQGQSIRYKQDVEPLEKQGKASAVGANIFLGVAVVAVGTATILFLQPTTKVTKNTDITFVGKDQASIKSVLFKSNL